MGLLDKVKNLFTEEYEEEVPIKKEVKHVEITSPRREVVKETVKEETKIPVTQATSRQPVEKKTEAISDSTALNREEKFKFPVYFDDEDFEDLPKKETPKKVEVKKEEPKVEPYKASKMIEEKRNFKPSPIISPVYGILDKNYKKEDISTRKERVVRTYHKEERLTVDDVRKKAFGTLEDELESTLVYEEETAISKTEPLESEIDIFKELEESNLRHSKEQVVPSEDGTSQIQESVDLSRELELQKQKIDEINAYIQQNTVKKEPIEDNILKYEDTKKEEIFNQVEEPVVELEPKNLENGDLFDLIDSMYEKRDEE